MAAMVPSKVGESSYSSNKKAPTGAFLLLENYFTFLANTYKMTQIATTIPIKV